MVFTATKLTYCKTVLAFFDNGEINGSTEFTDVIFSISSIARVPAGTDHEMIFFIYNYLAYYCKEHCSVCCRWNIILVYNHCRSQPISPTSRGHILGLKYHDLQ